MNYKQILENMFTFPLFLENYFLVDKKFESEWKLIQQFSQQIIYHKIYDDFGKYINQQILPYQATQHVFLEMDKVNELMLQIIKIRKDIIYSQHKEATSNENSSMFSTYQSLQNYLGKHFEIEMSEQYNNMKLTQYGIFDLLVFSHLHKSRSFHRVISKGVAPQISSLYSWYQEFAKQFNVIYPMDPNYLPKKEKRHEIQKQEQQKSNPELIESIRSGEFDIFKINLENGASMYTISTRDKEKMMVPHLVCAFARMEFAKYLTSKQVDWECEDGDRMTPLFYAIKSESIEMMEYIINQKVNLEHQDIQDRTPFYYACSLGQLHVIKYLQSKGANINARTALGRTPFSKSSFLGLYSVVEFLLQQPEIEFNYADKQGRDALHNAVFGPKGGRDGRKVGTWCQDSPQIAQLLLEHGMNIESCDKDNNTPLHVAASSEALQSIPILIAYGCDINRRNKWGETALMIAAKFNHCDTIKLLVDNNADVYLVNEGYTAMEVAAKNNQFEAYQILLDIMIPQLLQLQKFNKYKIQNVLQSLMELTKNLTNNQFIRYFLNKFEPIYDNDHASLIIDMQDCQAELMQSYLKNQIVTQEQINSAYELCLKRKNLAIFKQLCFNAKFRYKVSLQKSTISMLLDLPELNDLIFNFNIDWFYYRSKLGETFLHKLVEKRKTATLLLILNLFQQIIDKSNSVQINNSTLINIEKNQIYEYLIQQNEKSSSIIELAVIHKFMDIYQTLDHFISVNFEQKQGLKFKIPQYNLEIDNVTKLPTVILKQDLQFHFIKSFENAFDITEKEVNYFKRILNQYHSGKKALSEYYLNIQQSKQVILVEQLEQLINITQEITQYNIIGVDIEHYSDKIDEHKIAFACTLQLSTVDKDYIIDIMQLRENCKQHLMPIFESDKILKLFHGCDVDLRVLFSDLKLSVLNLLDTSKIDMALTKSPNAQSLEKLCKQYLNIHLDKLYQTSDWRIRPLPQEMVEYARLDSSCLLFLYPILIDECRKSNLVHKVYNQCQKLSLITQYPLINIKIVN